MENIWKKGVDYPSFMTEESLDMLSGGCLLAGESPRDAIMRLSVSASERIYELCEKNSIDVNKHEKLQNLQERFFNNIWENRFCPSSPMWANMGTTRGLPISCYGTYIDDSIASISYGMSEIMNMSALGGGTSATMNPIRAKGEPISGKGKSRGVGHFQELGDEIIKRIDQGEVRKGAFAVYLNIEHDDFYDHMNIRSESSKIQTSTFGVVVSDEFMEKVWAREAEALKRWALVLKVRSERGLPYIFFIDNANKYKPEWYSEMMIWFTNLCTEIMLPASNEESFVCCVASMNALKFGVWEDKLDDSVFLGTLFMEATMEDFIQKLTLMIEKDPLMVTMSRALKFAKRHRALGLGLLGYHSFLQSKMIPYESAEANMINGRIFSTLKVKSQEASMFLGELFGEAEVCKGYGRRHATNLAVAPTTGNASISGGVSPSTEINASNYFVVKLSKGKFIRKNQFLEKIFDERLTIEEKTLVWDEIMKNGGSVQNLKSKNLLTDLEKKVFETFKETNQMEIVRQASNRQVYIDQGQSINLNFPPDTPAKVVNKIIMEAHKLGIKSLYYQRSETTMRGAVDIFEDKGCIACEA